MPVKFIRHTLFAFGIMSVLLISFLVNNKSFQWYWLILFIVIFLYCAWKMFQYATNEDIVYRSLKNDINSADSRLDLLLTYVPLPGFIATFGLINQQLSHLDNTLFKINNVRAWIFDDNLDFLFYTYDNFVRSACLDFLESYNLHLSRISTENFWLLTLAFIYKTFLSIYFIQLILNIYKGHKKI